MTENLAGRGEGLRERIIAAMKRAWPKTKIASYNGVILELEKLCREIALEAAAPPSTAPQPKFPELKHQGSPIVGMDYDHKLTVITTELFEQLVEYGAALATSSPQAPQGELYCAACGSCVFDGHDKTCPDPRGFTVKQPGSPRKVGEDARHRYSMVAAFSVDFVHLLLLRKPDTHPNPLFRGRWTMPGGLVEAGETEREGAARELFEETGLANCDLWPILRFFCNCDPTEDEHEIFVYGATLPLEAMKHAVGNHDEPVGIFSALPEQSMWYLPQLKELAIARMRQPKALRSSSVPVGEQKQEEGV